AEAGRVEVELDRRVEGDREGRHAVTELAADEPVLVVQVVAHVRTQPDLRGGVGGGAARKAPRISARIAVFFIVFGNRDGSFVRGIGVASAGRTVRGRKPF